MVNRFLIFFFSLFAWLGCSSQKLVVDYKGFTIEPGQKVTNEAFGPYKFGGYFEGYNEYGDTIQWYFFQDGTFFDSPIKKRGTDGSCPIIDDVRSSKPYGWGFYQLNDKNELYVEFVWDHLKGLKFPIAKMYGYLNKDGTMLITKRYDPNMREMGKLNWIFSFKPCNNMPSSMNVVTKGLTDYKMNVGK